MENVSVTRGILVIIAVFVMLYFIIGPIVFLVTTPPIVIIMDTAIQLMENVYVKRAIVVRHVIITAYQIISIILLQTIVML